MKNVNIGRNPANPKQTIIFGGAFCRELGIDRLVGQRVINTAHLTHYIANLATKGFTFKVTEVTQVEVNGLTKFTPEKRGI